MPPPTSRLSDSVTQWLIYDCYMEDWQRKQRDIAAREKNDIRKKLKKKNINDATYEDLTATPRIGSVTADKVLRLRQVTPLNESILANTYGIGTSKLSALKEWFHVPAGKSGSS